MFLSEWREFPSAPCLAGKNLDDSSHLDVIEITRVPDMLPFLPDRAKDLSAPRYVTFRINVTQKNMPVPVAARSKAWVYGRSLAGIVGSNPAGGRDVCVECCVLSGRGLSDGLITRPEESYRL